MVEKLARIILTDDAGDEPLRPVDVGGAVLLVSRVHLVGQHDKLADAQASKTPRRPRTPSDGTNRRRPT